MRCFYHRDVEAVGTCKSCGRGLCPACVAEVENGLACRSRCEGEVRAINRIISRNKTAFERTSSAYIRVALFYAAVGAVLIAGAILDWRGMAWVLAPAGIILVVAAVVHYSTGRKFESD
jgi:hypothetical protein